VQKKIVFTLIPVFVLVAAIPIAVYLSKQTQVFQPRAAISCRSAGGQPVETLCIEGVKMLVFEYESEGVCKLFYEASAESCQLTESPSPSQAASSSPIPSYSPEASIEPSPGVGRRLGDADNDGDVDRVDIDVLISEFGKAGSNLKSDFNQNGYVDIFDYNILIRNIDS
jgi:hypothetical protein